MSDHGTQHHDGGNNSGELKSKTAFRSSFWFVIILVGLFIASLNFIEVMSHGSEGHENKEATSGETLKGESGLGKPMEGAETAHAPIAAPDSAAHEAGH